MLFSGILTALGMVVIVAKFSKPTLKRILGYDWFVDIVATLGLIVLFGTTGTYSGMMASIITGLCISAVLYVSKKFIGYQKYEMSESGKRQWKEYPGQWTLFYMANKASEFVYNRSTNFIDEIRRGWNSEKKVA